MGRKFDYKTQVMGASFRKVEQVTLLAGSDLLTISPDILEKLVAKQGEVTPQLTVATAKASDAKKLHLDEKTYRWMHNEDPMAVDKLSDGIRKFNADARSSKNTPSRWWHSKFPERPCPCGITRTRHTAFGRDWGRFLTRGTGASPGRVLCSNQWIVSALPGPDIRAQQPATQRSGGTR